jgi:sterol desaturase/sphingolipid hydroxylase (fatty acid hydroxylase superfamily)
MLQRKTRSTPEAKMPRPTASPLLAPVPDAQVAALVGVERPGPGPSRPRPSAAWAARVDATVVAALTASGLLCPQGPRLFYTSLLAGFAGIATFVLTGAALVTWFSERRPDRLQGPRRRPSLALRGARDTALAAWVAACLLAWPLARLEAGAPTGLTWQLAEAGGATRVLLQTAGAVLVLDAWLYWKHRLLHTRWLFPFHRAHHVYRDPTAYAGFSVGPVESLLTFWPVVIWAHPKALHYAPLYFGLVAAFIFLNFYLHCGIASRLLEGVLPRLFVNTSAFHNRHHANAEVHFGEALTLWDHLCGTREGGGTHDGRSREPLAAVAPEDSPRPA